MKGDKGFFVAYLAILFALPLPLGSNREWAWLSAAALTFLLAALVLWKVSNGQLSTSPVLARSRLALICLFAWLLFGLFQILPLPPALLGLLSPERLAWPLPWLSSSDWITISVSAHGSALVLLQSLFFVTLFVLTLQLVNSRSRVQRLLLLLVLAGVTQAVYGSFMTMSGVEWGFMAKKISGVGVATGTFINRNHLAGMLVLCLSAGIGLLLSQMRTSNDSDGLRQRLRGWVRVILGPRMRLRIYLGVMVVALVLTHSRMGNAAFFSALLIAGVLGLYLMRSAPRSMFVLIASLLVVDILIVGTWFGVEQVIERIQQTGTYQQSSGRYRDVERFDVDSETLAAMKDYRWVGSGGDSFQIVFQRYRPSDLGAYFDHAHNDHLEFLLEFGLVGCLPLVVFFIASMVTAIRVQVQRRDPLMRATGFAVIMAGVATVIHSTVDFNLHIPANAAYLVVILALAWIAAGLTTRRIK